MNPVKKIFAYVTLVNILVCVGNFLIDLSTVNFQLSYDVRYNLFVPFYFTLPPISFLCLSIGPHSNTAIMRTLVGLAKLANVFAILMGFIYLINAAAGDCNQVVSGQIIDSKTDKPVSGAKIENANNSGSYDYSDSTGHFEVSSISGGLFGCPPMSIIISDSGYKLVKLDIEAGDSALVYLSLK